MSKYLDINGLKYFYDQIKDRLNITAVDLGLSVKWASCNIGAEHEYDFGDYYAWGETKTKRTYGWPDYQFTIFSFGQSASRDPSMSKYNTTDKLNTLEANNDVAVKKLCSRWRMPTTAEFQELGNSCSFDWTTTNGIQGCKLTSKKNGNHIFLPAAGWIDGTEKKTDINGYWTASLASDNSTSATFAHYY